MGNWNPDWDDKEYAAYLAYHRLDEIHRDWAIKRFRRWLELLSVGEIKTSRSISTNKEEEDWLIAHLGAPGPEVKLDKETLNWLMNNMESLIEFPSELSSRLKLENAIKIRSDEQLKSEIKYDIQRAERLDLIVSKLRNKVDGINAVERFFFGTRLRHNVIREAERLEARAKQLRKRASNTKC